MKLLGTTLLILTLALVSACNKDSGGGGGGSGNTATQPSPTPIPTPGTANTDPYDNRSGPSIPNDNYSEIRARDFTIFNTDGMGVSGCEGDPQMLCLRGGIRRPLREFTIMSGPGYLSCINGYVPINAMNIQQMPIRSLCQLDAMRGYTVRTRTSSSTASAAKAGFCASRFIDETTVRVNFFFDDRGILNFAARVGIGDYDYLYRATGIGYKYNVRTNSLIIGAFMARGNNPTMRYLAVNSLSGLRNPRNQIYNNMVLKEARRVTQSDISFGLSSGGAYQFAESILFRFSNYDSSQYSYQQFAVNLRAQGQVGFMPQDPRFANIDPRFSNSNVASETKFLVAGGNLILLPRELLDSMGGGPGGVGSPYIPFNDPRN